VIFKRIFCIGFLLFPVNIRGIFYNYLTIRIYKNAFSPVIFEVSPVFALLIACYFSGFFQPFYEKYFTPFKIKGGLRFLSNKNQNCLMRDAAS